jgi:hypothetical protein
MIPVDQMNSEEVLLRAIHSLDSEIRSKLAAKNVLQQRLRHIQLLSEEVSRKEYQRLQKLPASVCQMEKLLYRDSSATEDVQMLPASERSQHSRPHVAFHFPSLS